LGVAMLMKKKWTWKANFAQHVIMFAIAITVLLLLSRPNTRLAFRNGEGSTQSEPRRNSCTELATR
jgi:hypothetical protein